MGSDAGREGRSEDNADRRTGTEGVTAEAEETEQPLEREGSRILGQSSKSKKRFAIPVALADSWKKIKEFIWGKNETIPQWMSNPNFSLKDEATQLTESGAGRVVFLFGKKLSAGVTYYDDATGQYVVEINLAANANAARTAKHESIHLWLKALNREHQVKLVSVLARKIFGDDYEKAYNAIAPMCERLYPGRGDIEALINEELIAYAHGNFNLEEFDFTKYNTRAVKAVKEAGLRDIATGNAQSENARTAALNGWNDPVYLGRQGLTDVVNGIVEGENQQKQDAAANFTKKGEKKKPAKQEKQKATTEKAEAKQETPKTAKPETKTTEDEAAKKKQQAAKNFTKKANTEPETETGGTDKPAKKQTGRGRKPKAKDTDLH